MALNNKVTSKVTNSADVSTTYLLAPSQVPVWGDLSASIFYYHHSATGELEGFDPQVTEVLGYSPAECQAHWFEFLSDSNINQSITKKVSDALSDIRQAPFEIEIYDKSGATRRLQITMVPHYDDGGQLKKVESIVQDLTPLHHRLSGYQRKSMLLDEAEKIADMGTWDWDLIANTVRWSRSFYTLVQLDQERVTPNLKIYLDLLSPEDAASLHHNIISAIKNNQIFEHSHRLFLADGSIKYIETRGKSLLDTQGKPIRIIGTIMDVTKQIKTKSQLEKVYWLVNSSVNEIYIIDQQSFRFTFVSDGACRNLGYSQKEITQLTPFDLCPILPRVQILELISPVMEQSEEQVIFEASHLRKNGTYYPVEIRLQLMVQDGTPMFVAVAMDISKQKAAQQKVREQAELLRSVIDATDDLIFFKDRNSLYQGCNKAFEQRIGLNEYEIINHTDAELFSPQLAAIYAAQDEQIFAQGTTVHAQDWVVYPNGTKVLLETTKKPYHNEIGDIEGVVGISSDVTHHWQYEKNLKNQAQFLQSIIDNINESIMVIDCNLNIQLINGTAKQFVAEGILAQPQQRILSSADNTPQDCPINAAFKDKIHQTVIHNHTADDGKVKHIELMVSPILDEQGEVSAVIEIGRDITGHLQLQHQLRQQKEAFQRSAHHDLLTGLPNRALFQDRLVQSIAKAKRSKIGLAVLFIDLDKFKQINDNYGHDIGDKVLQETAQRIQGCVREADSVARLGGDEFTVILENVREPQDAALIARKINQVMQTAIVIDNLALMATSSIGIAIYPENGDSIDQLLKSADHAMYQVKQENRDDFSFYDPNIGKT